MCRRDGVVVVDPASHALEGCGGGRAVPDAADLAGDDVLIVVHRLRDVRVVPRQGLRSALTRGGVGVARMMCSAPSSSSLAGLTADAGAGLITLARHSSRLAWPWCLFIGDFAEGLGAGSMRQVLPRACRGGRIFGNLAVRVRTMLRTAPLLRTVAMRVAESLHVSRITVLPRGARSGLCGIMPWGVRRQPTVANLGSASRPYSCTSVEQLRWSGSTMQSSGSGLLTNDAERASLEQLESKMLLPLSVNEKILGIMSLGAKQSEEPFSTTDVRLLGRSPPNGAHARDGRLTAAVAADVAVHAKEKRDLEIARDVQERLFPQDIRLSPGSTTPGRAVRAVYRRQLLRLHPAAERRLRHRDRRRIGQRIPAALLIETLRASLQGAQMIRRQRIRRADAQPGRDACTKLGGESYATFFYGRLEPHLVC